MMERKFVSQKKREYEIEEFIAKSIPAAGLSKIKLQRTPLGEKIIVYASRPGLIIGTKGQNITRLTNELKKKYNLENPQIEIGEIENIGLDAKIMAEKIANSLERFGPARFKGVGHKSIEEAMSNGALGIEIIISGKIPGARAKSWRFYKGYLKKCGNVAVIGVNTAYASAKLKTGIIGIKVSIMPPTTKLPDKVTMLSEIIKKIEPAEKIDEFKETEKKEIKEIKKDAQNIEKAALPADESNES